MTQDFTRVGRRHAPTTQNRTPLAANQRAVLRAIYFSAAGFFAAGIWLVSGGGDTFRTAPFPEETAQLVGYAFISVAAIDGVVAAMLKRFWEKSGEIAKSETGKN